MEASPYPLVLDPIILEKVWGGRRLEGLGKTLPTPAGLYGESWELADMASTSASGAGGGAFHSRIRNGSLRGQSVAQARAVFKAQLLGSIGDHAPASDESASSIPVLIKFLDASQNLSVQVHPSPAYATAMPGAYLKTECWYILAAEPGAKIYKGIRPGVSRMDFEAAARQQSSAIVDMLCAIPAVVGECHNLPSGTVHALGAGVLVAEVQTPSDTTFRLYDWGRAGRELHVQAALECASFPGEPGHAELLQGLTVARLGEGELCTRLVSTPFFDVDETTPQDGDEFTIGYACRGGRERHSRPDAGRDGERPNERAYALIVLAGDAVLRPRSGAGFASQRLLTGDTVLVPSAIAADTVLTANREVRVLRVRLG